MKDKVNEIIVEMLAVTAQAVAPEAKLEEDLGADSLDMVHLLVTLEEEFSVEIPDEAAEKYKTVTDVYNLMEEITGKK